MAERIDVDIYRLPSGGASSAVWRRISWGAVFAGLFVALALMIWLMLLGAALGLSVQGTGDGEQDQKGIGIAVGIWWLLSEVISLFVGGWVAGRLIQAPEALDAGLHGATIWGLKSVLAAWLLVAGAGAVLGGATNVMQGALTGAGAAVGGNVQAADTQAAPDSARDLGIEPKAAKQHIARLAYQVQGKAAVASWWIVFIMLASLVASFFGGWVGMRKGPELRARR